MQYKSYNGKEFQTGQILHVLKNVSFRGMVFHPGCLIKLEEPRTPDQPFYKNNVAAKVLTPDKALDGWTTAIAINIHRIGHYLENGCIELKAKEVENESH